MKKNIYDLIQTITPLGSCRKSEYKFVARRLDSLAPCNALYFGVGYDSKLWDTINAEGNNLFLEDSQEWIDTINPTLVNSKIEKVKYTTKRTQWKKIFKKTNKLIMQLPDTVWQTNWNFIFIDGPRGDKDFCPGRMQSIYTASLLAAKSRGVLRIFAHDYNRELERRYCNKYFGKNNLKKVVRRMACYKRGK
jgi:uncharacterized protein (TIGR01627 family)